MDLTPLGFPHRRNVAIVVGAGATRGASFVGSSPLRVPPLDANFFELLRSSASLRSDDIATNLLSFVQKEFGSLDIGMETFYSQTYLHDKFVGGIQSGQRGPRSTTYKNALKWFEIVLVRLFREALDGQRCLYHESLVNALDANDVVISFNYDCLMDSSMRRARRRWDPAKGYGFTVKAGLSAWRDNTGQGRPPKVGIRLLKPHGSLNWASQSGSFNLLADPYQDERRDLAIVPPLWQKDFVKAPYSHIWPAARKVLRSVNALIVIGYSLPETDVYTQALLRIDVGKLDFLCVVNPDKTARGRIKRVLGSSVGPRTHLLELDGLADFAGLLPP